MEISKEEFVRNIVKAQAKRRYRREQEYRATIRESMDRCRKKSGKRHIRMEGKMGNNFWADEVVRLYREGYAVLEAIEIVKKMMF